MPCRSEPSQSPPIILGAYLTALQVRQRPWRDWVRDCLARHLDQGFVPCGRGGPRVFAAVVDVRNGCAPADPLPLDEAWRVQRPGRRATGGANLNLDHGLLRTLHALSALDGESRWAAAADEHCRRWLDGPGDERGFWWWGWHRHIDLLSGACEGHDGSPHELHGTEAPPWDLFWRLTPASTQREVEAIWRWHVVDKTTGEINRHGDGHRGCDFAMTAGGLVAAFAAAAAAEGGPWRERARLLADYHWSSRDAQSGLFPNRPNAGRTRFDGSCVDTSITGPWCHGLLSAWRLAGDDVLRERAVATLRSWHARARREDGGYHAALQLDGSPIAARSGDPPDTAIDLSRNGGAAYHWFEPHGQADPWQPYAAGYEHPLATAQACALGHALDGDADLLAHARAWAAWLVRERPIGRCHRQATFYRPYARDWAVHGTYAAHHARVIGLLTHLHVLDPAGGHLAIAQDLAAEAIASLHWHGWLRSHPAKPYAEAVDGTGLLLHALLALDCVERGASDRERCLIPGCPLRIGLDVW